MTKIFVYGTLQRGYGNNRCLSNSEFVAQAVTKDTFALFNSGFPIAVRDSEKFESLPVIGEVWEVSDVDLGRCDALEGHPNWYRREDITVLYEDGREEVVQMYVQPNTYNGCHMCSVVSMYGIDSYRWHR